MRLRSLVHVRFAGSLVLLGATVAAVLTVAGCHRSKRTKKIDACALVSDAEMTNAVGAEVDAHKAVGEACDWTFKGGKVMTVHVAVLSPLAATIIPQLAKPEAVSGIGDRAEWSGGFAPQLRVYKGDRVLHVMMTETAPEVTIQEGKSHVVEQKALPGGGSTTITTTEENLDFPEMKTKMIAIARLAAPRL